MTTPSIVAERTRPRRRPPAKGERGYNRKALEAYFTEARCVHALLPAIEPRGVVWEPCCGDGAIARILEGAGYDVLATDLYDHGYGVVGLDFLNVQRLPLTSYHVRDVPKISPLETIFTNFPYSLEAGGEAIADGEDFVRHALRLLERPRGMLVALFPIGYSACASRTDLFELPCFAKKIELAFRPKWFGGGGGAPRGQFAWYVWDWRHDGPATVEVRA